MIATAIARKIAADIAIAALAQRRAMVLGLGRIAPVRDTAKIEPLAQHSEARKCAIHPHRAEAEMRAALTTGMSVVRATETFVRGDEALVEADDGEKEFHGLIDINRH